MGKHRHAHKQQGKITRLVRLKHNRFMSMLRPSLVLLWGDTNVSAMQAFTKRFVTRTSYVLRHGFMSSTTFSLSDLDTVSSKGTLFLNASHNTDPRNFSCAVLPLPAFEFQITCFLNSTPPPNSVVGETKFAIKLGRLLVSAGILNVSQYTGS